ncbi:MAG: helix-turn-helix domain-containing protein [Erysipelotrichaceae bacterium]
MNDAKTIGLFIKELRTEKGYTQAELADKLNISDRTVSKYECGRGIPDIDILLKLSETFDVSINEMLNGQRFKDFKSEADKNLIEILKNFKFKIIARNIILSVLLVLIILNAILYFVDMNRIRTNQPVLFSTWGYDYTAPLNIPEEENIQAINRYLDSHYKDYTYEVLHVLRQDDSHYVYSCILSVEGRKIPAKFYISAKDGILDVYDSRMARDDFYEEDLANMFDQYLIDRIREYE